MKNKSPIQLIGLTLSLVVAVVVVANGFDLSWHTIDGGGIGNDGASTGGGFELSGTIGQPDAGKMTGGGFELIGGFLPGAGFADCNTNGIDDAVDISTGASRDCNSNGVPDECEPDSAFADLDADGDVDVNDFLTFSNCFNGALNPPSAGCANLCADIDDDGDVDVNDFLTFSNCFNGALNPPACP